MAGRLVFLLEEPSMRVLLDAWLPRLFPGWIDGQHFLCIPHEGKSDLDRSVSRKLQAWRVPGDRFVILRDTDGADCIDLKARYRNICQQSSRPETLIRLVCQELESWYLGDLCALASAFGGHGIDTPANRKRYIQPDDWQKPSTQVKHLVPTFQKVAGARAMAAHLDPATNRSHSLRIFVDGLRRQVADMAAVQQGNG